MSRLKHCDSVWWLTEMIRVVTIVCVIVFIDVFKSYLYSDFTSNTIFEDAMILIGTLVFIRCFYDSLHNGILAFRKKIRLMKKK